jgi:hypothetical protein
VIIIIPYFNGIIDFHSPATLTTLAKTHTNQIILALPNRRLFSLNGSFDKFSSAGRSLETHFEVEKFFFNVVSRRC